MRSISALALAAGVALSAIAPGIARAQGNGVATSGTLFFTTFQVPAIPNPLGGGNLRNEADATIQKVNFSYDGNVTFTLGTPTVVKDFGPNGNADGIVFAPNGNLLIGGSTTGNILEVDPTNGNIVHTATVGGNQPFHLSLDPSGTKVYSGGSTVNNNGDTPGPLGTNPFPLANGTSTAITGDDTGITQVAFAAGKVFYTSSGFAGTGDFGTIDLSTGKTTRLIANLPAAHGITFDAFSGDLILAGDSHVSQIDPANPTTVLSDLDLTNDDVQLDQVSADGKGHLFVSDNGNVVSLAPTPGGLVFIDYSEAMRVADTAAFVTDQSLAVALDDLAPLSGPGSPPNGPPPPPGVPLPAAAWMSLFTLAGLGGISGLRARFRRA